LVEYTLLAVAFNNIVYLLGLKKPI